MNINSKIAEYIRNLKPGTYYIIPERVAMREYRLPFYIAFLIGLFIRGFWPEGIFDGVTAIVRGFATFGIALLILTGLQILCNILFKFSFNDSKILKISDDN